MLVRGVPEHIRSDNGSEMTAKVTRNWLAQVGAKTLFIEPGSPWENGYCESFNGKLRNECLNAEIFYSLRDAQVIVEMWRAHYNTRHPHTKPSSRPRVIKPQQRKPNRTRPNSK
jgi:transposase InsO family protein